MIGVGVGVSEGVIREKRVGEGINVCVGSRVGVSVTIEKGVAVQVASSCSGVIVAVGGAFGSTMLAFKGLMADWGKIKIATK